MNLNDWVKTSKDGSKNDLPQKPTPAVWTEVQAEAGNCLGKNCQHYSMCHWQAAKRRVMSANIIITNHHLLMADLSLRATGKKLLPDYDYIVIDEAHSLEHIACEHLGIRTTEYQIKFLLNKLYNS